MARCNWRSQSSKTSLGSGGGGATGVYCLPAVSLLLRGRDHRMRVVLRSAARRVSGAFRPEPPGGWEPPTGGGGGQGIGCRPSGGKRPPPTWGRCGHCVDAVAIPLEAGLLDEGNGIHVDEFVDVKGPKESGVANVLPPEPTSVVRLCR